MTNPHKILGVRKNASAKAIRCAYHRLAKLHHPDANVGDDDAPRRFKEVTEAYAILTGRYKEPDNTDNAAYGILQMAFAQILLALVEKGIAPQHEDYVDLMRQHLAEQRKGVKEMLGKLTKIESALAQMRGRFGGKQQEALDAMVAANEAQVAREKDKQAEQLAILERALALLDGCTFRAEPRERTYTARSATFQNFWFTPTGTASTNT